MIQHHSSLLIHRMKHYPLSRQRRAIQHGLLFLFMLVISGCNSAPKVSLRDVPVPPELARYEGAAETTLDGMWSAMLLSRARLPAERDVDYYWLPNSMKWEAVAEFYYQHLDDTWRMDQEDVLPHGERWTRASVAGNQVLVVSEIGIQEEQGRILLVSLITE